jgi:hypothetical protein
MGCSDGEGERVSPTAQDYYNETQPPWFESLYTEAAMRKPEISETRDVPFLKNDLNDSTATTGKPLDTADAPGKADSEMVEDGELPQPISPQSS